MLVWLKRAVVELTVGAVLGFVLWCLLGKRILSAWFGSPGGSFSCQLDVVNALDRFVAMQLYSAIAGAVVAFIGVQLLRRWWAKSRTKLKAAPAAPGPVP